MNTKFGFMAVAVIFSAGMVLAGYDLTTGGTSTTTWSYTYVDGSAPDTWTDTTPPTKLLNRDHTTTSTGDNLQANSVIWSSSKMAAGQSALIIDLQKDSVIDYSTFGGYIHTTGYSIPGVNIYVSSDGVNFSKIATYAGSVAAGLGYYDSNLTGAQSTTTQLGKFDTTNVGRYVKLEFLAQNNAGGTTGTTHMGSVDSFGRYSTYTSTGVGFTGYDYGILPGETSAGVGNFQDSGTDLINHGSWGTDADSVIWGNSQMSSTGASIVFALDGAGTKGVSGVSLGSYFHSNAYAIPGLTFEVETTGDLDNPNWVQIGTNGGLAYTSSGPKTLNITGLDDTVAAYYLRMNTDTSASRLSLGMVELTLVDVPEPATLALLGMGAVLAVGRKRKH